MVHCTVLPEIVYRLFSAQKAEGFESLSIMLGRETGNIRAATHRKLSSATKRIFLARTAVLGDLSAVQHKQHSYLSGNKQDHVGCGVLKTQHLSTSDLVQHTQPTSTPRMVSHKGSHRHTGTAQHLLSTRCGELGSVWSSEGDEEHCMAIGVFIL